MFSCPAVVPAGRDGQLLGCVILWRTWFAGGPDGAVLEAAVVAVLALTAGVGQGTVRRDHLIVGVLDATAKLLVFIKPLDVVVGR